MPEKIRKTLADKRAKTEQAVIADFRAIVHRINHFAAQVDKQCGISSTQLWALREITEKPGIRVSGISAALAIHPSTASNLLDKLEVKKLIRRARSNTDQRAVSLHPTAAGKRIVLKAPGKSSNAFNAALANLSDAQVNALSRSIHALRDAFPAND